MGSSSPLLMVNMLSNKFYSLAEKKEVTLGHSGAGAVPDEGTVVVGSSHGWLALFSERSFEFFLWNPISGERINLPSVAKLPNIPEENLKRGYGCVLKVIVSSSSVGYAVMSYGPQEGLAFCCPRQSSSEWTTICIGEIAYQDFAYSTRLNRLFCITDFGELARWDLGDLLLPTPRIDCNRIYLEEEEEEEADYEPIYYMVVAEHSNEAFVVVRKEVSGDKADGCMRDIPHRAGLKSHDCFYKTADFDVYKVVMDGTKMSVSYMDGSLNGLAMFVGINHSFALPAANYPGLNPDSIYFTDSSPICTSYTLYAYGGNEVGIFDYKKKTFDPCYFPYHIDAITKVTPLPVWFAPTPITSKI